MDKILLLNGPNLNLLGHREPEVYGNVTLKDIEKKITMLGTKHQFEVICFQSNHEGEIIDQLHSAFENNYKGVIFNPAAFTHYSYAIRDAIASIQLPVVEVHISNVHSRESFRQKSVIAPVTIGQIVGFGSFGYELAFTALVNFINEKGIQQ